MVVAAPDAPRGIGLPVSFDGTRPPVERGAPALGEANAEFGAPVPGAR
jgi:crotonobetainyl-CoA:carnitine CoA-transferase CaiB-like acyl-CoA transferase